LAELGRLVEKVRSKNAGPFWLTIDIFCGTQAAYERLAPALTKARVAAVFGIAADEVRRFDLPDLAVIKFSLPRPAVQGSVADRDMHGASWAALLAEIDVTTD